MRKQIMNFVYIIIITYVVALAGLYIFQRTMIYIPDQSLAFDQNEKRLFTHQTNDDLILTSFFTLPRIGEDIFIIMFHGNAGNAGDRGAKMLPFINAGYGALVMGYRGYGGNAGKPSEQAFYADADALMKTLIKKGYKPQNIIIYGESLGTGVASKIAAHYPVKGLIMDAPFTSLADVASAQYPIFPVKTLIKDRFDTLGRINDIAAPILFMHGTNDNVIPVHHSQTLYDAYQGPKQLKIFAGGNHSSLIDFGADVVALDFIKGLK